MLLETVARQQRPHELQVGGLRDVLAPVLAERRLRVSGRVGGQPLPAGPTGCTCCAHSLLLRRRQGAPLPAGGGGRPLVVARGVALLVLLLLLMLMMMLVMLM